MGSHSFLSLRTAWLETVPANIGRGLRKERPWTSSLSEVNWNVIQTLALGLGGCLWSGVLGGDFAFPSASALKQGT